MNYSDESVAVDMEYFRSARYDANAVYPNGSGNAFPGYIAGGDIRLFLKTQKITRTISCCAHDAFMAADEEARLRL